MTDRILVAMTTQDISSVIGPNELYIRFKQNVCQRVTSISLVDC